MPHETNSILIDSFLARYRREYDFFDQAARLIAQILEERLIEAGIRSIVTSRAKSLRSLEPKVRLRALDKNYTCEDDIFKDIVDLAGVRVAMYFPGDKLQVDSIIQTLFLLQDKPKEFPGESKVSKFKKRFSGYWATHYRVQLIETNLNDVQKRYAEAKIEIQVASVLMHAWSEVEHDLVYKPLQGELSDDEYSILDEINGMVLAGEIALELLQKAGIARIAPGGRAFKNHYDLASYLLNKFEPTGNDSVGETALGRIDLLYELLKYLEIGTPEKLEPLLQSLSSNLEKRPLADQIIDQLLSDDPKRYVIYVRLRGIQSKTRNYVGKTQDELSLENQKELNLFMQQWSSFEKEASATANRLDLHRNYMSSAFLSRLGIGDKAVLKDFERIRRMRNEVVHGLTFPALMILEFQAARFKKLLR